LTQKSRRVPGIIIDNELFSAEKSAKIHVKQGDKPNQSGSPTLRTLKINPARGIWAEQKQQNVMNRTIAGLISVCIGMAFFTIPVMG
jgi:hypothetical protein